MKKIVVVVALVGIYVYLIMVNMGAVLHLSGGDCSGVFGSALNTLVVTSREVGANPLGVVMGLWLVAAILTSKLLRGRVW